MELTLTINGTSATCPKDTSITQILAARGINSQRVAVAINRTVIFHQDFPITFPKAGDDIEILTPMVGG